MTDLIRQQLNKSIADFSVPGRNGYSVIEYDNLVKIAAHFEIDYRSLKLDQKWAMDIDTAELELVALKVNPKDAKCFIEVFHSNFNQRTGDICIYYYESELRRYIKAVGNEK